MEIESGDPGCLAALTKQLGHEPPFSEEELAAIESLTVEGALDLSPLEACPGLRHLRVLASEVDSFGFCEPLTELAHLEILASKVGSMAGAAQCRKLERVDLLYTSVSDAAEVLGIASFRRGTLIGNPWDGSSWSYLQNECAQAPMFVELPSDDDRETCRALWEKDEACSGAIAGGGGFLVRPGLPQLTKNPFDALDVPAAAIRQEMKAADFSVAKMFSEYAKRVATPDLSALAQARTLGTGAEALQWIAGSSMVDDDKAAASAFVRRFPDVIFYKASEALLEREAQGAKYALPGWYRTQRATLDGWLPNAQSSTIRIDGYELSGSPRADRAAQLSFYLGLYPHAKELEAKLLAAGIVNIGLCAEDPEIYLAMRLGDADLQIYDYHFEDISDALSEGRDPSTSLYPAFRSYASMLSHVVALQPKGGDPILASG